MPKPRRLSVCLPPYSTRANATNGQTNEIYFIERVCLSLNLMEFASEFVCLSVLDPVRRFLADRRTEYISLNYLSVCRITYSDLTDEFVCLSPTPLSRHDDDQTNGILLHFIKFFCLSPLIMAFLGWGKTVGKSKNKDPSEQNPAAAAAGGGGSIEY